VSSTSASATHKQAELTGKEKPATTSTRHEHNITHTALAVIATLCGFVKPEDQLPLGNNTRNKIFLQDRPGAAVLDNNFNRNADFQ
jgi:hypothetical protein